MPIARHFRLAQFASHTAIAKVAVFDRHFCGVAPITVGVTFPIARPERGGVYSPKGGRGTTC